MSGHSKWSTIKHKKGILDAKKGVLSPYESESLPLRRVESVIAIPFIPIIKELA